MASQVRRFTNGIGPVVQPMVVGGIMPAGQRHMNTSFRENTSSHTKCVAGGNTSTGHAAKRSLHDGGNAAPQNTQLPDKRSIVNSAWNGVVGTLTTEILTRLTNICVSTLRTEKGTTGTPVKTTRLSRDGAFRETLLCGRETIARAL